MPQQQNHVLALPAEFLNSLDGLVAKHNPIPQRYESLVVDLFKEMDTAAGTLHHAATGLAGEAGEFLDASKKVWVYGKALDAKNFVEELGDLYFYWKKALLMSGLTEEQIRAYNMEKLGKRYPDGVYTDTHAQLRLDKPEERTFFGSDTASKE